MVIDNETEKLVNRIVEANKEYRAGTPVMSDQEYDDLLDILKGRITNEEYEKFVATLNEGSIEKNIDGKVKHPVIMGSLEKVKAECPEEVVKFIRENVKNGLSISSKVDGISSRAEYINGKLTSLTSRGDGYAGQDLTSKAKYIKFLPQTLDNGFTGNIRGELVILRDDYETIKDRYVNSRNACAGIMNRKDGDRKFNESELRLVSFIPYTILGDEYTKVEQFNLLKEMGFHVATNTVIRMGDLNLDTIADTLFKMTTLAVEKCKYDVDGLVVCDVNWRNENDEYRPDGCKAYKQNQSVGITTIIGFDWGTPSASGKMTPVALLEPVFIAGTTVKRVTCNNITWMEDLGVEIGKKVKISKQGEIIPKIIEVLD